MHLDILKRLIGKEIDVIIDRPIGTTHPKFKDTLYPVNYGYIDSVLGGDKEFQKAYILGETKPLDIYRGKAIAIIRRFDDNEDKLSFF